MYAYISLRSSGINGTCLCVMVAFKPISNSSSYYILKYFSIFLTKTIFKFWKFIDGYMIASGFGEFNFILIVNFIQIIYDLKDLFIEGNVSYYLIIVGFSRLTKYNLIIDKFSQLLIAPTTPLSKFIIFCILILIRTININISKAI